VSLARGSDKWIRHFSDGRTMKSVLTVLMSISTGIVLLSGVPNACALSRVGAICLNPLEGNIRSAVMDSASGFAYFGTGTTPSMIVKVRLSDFTRIGALMLDPGEGSLWSAVIDTANGFAYFGTDTTPGIVVKVRLSDFTRAGALTLNIGEGELRSAVIDTGNGYAYFGTYGGYIVKVRLSDFTRVGAMMPGRGFLASAVIDTVNGYAYFGTDTSPGVVVKVRLSDFTRVGAIALYPGENELRSTVIDSANGFAYFGTDTGKIVKVRLSDFTRVGTLSTDKYYLRSAVIDTANGFAYFGGGNGAVKVRLSDFTRVAGLDLEPGDNPLESAVIDSASGFAYFGTASGLLSPTQPDQIVKVRLSDFTRVGALALSRGEVGDLRSAVIDAANGFAYFGICASPSIVVKVRLSDFTRVGTLRLDESYLSSAVIDTGNGFAYFGTNTDLGIVVKVRLSDFTRVGAIVLESGEGYLRSAVIDTVNGFVYFGTGTSPGRVVKIRLSDFSRVGALTLNPGEDVLFSAVIDAANGFAYFGTGSIIVKVRLSDFTRVGSIALYPGESFSSAVIDTAGGYAYFGLVKIRLSDFTRVGASGTLGAVDGYPSSVAVIDTANGYLYFGESASHRPYHEPGRVLKFRLSDLTFAGDLRLSTDESYLWSAVIDTANGYAYFGTCSNVLGYVGRIVKVALDRGGFDFSLGNSGGITLMQGSSGFNKITASLISGPSYTVTLSASGLPSGASALFNPSSGDPTFSSTCTIKTSSSTPVGSYMITVTGTDGRLTRSTTFTLTLNPEKGSCRIALDASPKPGYVGKPVTIFGTMYGSWRCISGVVIGKTVEITAGWGFRAVAVTNDRGEFSIDTSAPPTVYSPPVPYPITATFYEDEDLTGTSTTITYQIIAKIPTSITISYVANREFGGYLRRQDTGTYLAGKPVKLTVTYLSGTTWQTATFDLQTRQDGYYSLEFLFYWNQATIAFEGDESYAPSQATITR